MKFDYDKFGKFVKDVLIWLLKLFAFYLAAYIIINLVLRFGLFLNNL